MGYNTILNDIIENKLLSLHTAFVGKILSTDGKMAKVQPLNLIKAVGGKSQKQTPITIPVLRNARYKLASKNVEYGGIDDLENWEIENIINGNSIDENTEQNSFAETVITTTPLQAGDIVFCMCADRDITEARQGQMSNAPCDRHSMSNAVVIGVF